MTEDREILTAEDVATELRCSKAHVYNVINGRVKNVSRLPSISLGRRKLVRRGSLERWKNQNEQGDSDMILSPEITSVGRMDREERSHA